MRFSRMLWALAVFITFPLCAVLAEGAPKSIREELKEMLAEQGLTEGLNRQSRSIVGIGVSWSEKEPELVARAMAAARISCQLNTGEISAMTKAVEGDKGAVVTSVIKKVFEGYVTGVREVARVTRRDGSGRMVVGIALRWTLKQELEAAQAVSVPRDEESTLAQELSTIKHLSRMAGPQFWIDDVRKRSWLIGIGVFELKASDARTVRTATRLAQLKARRYLLFHFCQYDRDVEVLKRDFREDDASLTSDLDTLHIVKGKGVVAPGLGVADVYEDIVTENGRRYAVCVSCLIREK